MSKIDHQALREAAERATPAMERLLMLPVDDDLLSEQELKDYGVDIDALNAFKFLAGPETVLALLDERERNQQYIKLRDQENEDIALTVGKLRVELEHYKSREERVTKLVLDNSTSWDVLYEKLEAAERSMAEQSAIVAAAEKLVRCKGRYHSELNYRALAKLFGVITPDLPPLVHENVHYADAADVEITALRQRIAELEAKLETADKLQDSAFRDGLKAGFSYGQTDDQSGFAQCMSAYSTRTDIGVKVE
ncbi:ead/Ea22-like family protein [Salmonella enterica]|nr:ead/Ea22-like family protein [Salmonella enterica]EBT8903003.1 ead/Ea22-like family protein [Salmonella enterica]ELW6658681.1 ead/Ea22-like family protein [Salmonella enterica]